MPISINKEKQGEGRSWFYLSKQTSLKILGK
jgi:hypothetical protein